MINELETLRRFVRDMRRFESALRSDCGAYPQKFIAQELGKALDNCRDNPIRSEGGGALRTLPRSWENERGDSRIVIAEQPSQAERDAAQEAAWKELFS